MLSLTAFAILVVIAHPDDETLFSGFLHALAHKFQAKVDLVCITNGEGGFRYSGPAESIYGNIRLSEESVARQYLPRIRQQELLASGKILGIRKHFFYDQLDLKYTVEVEDVVNYQWDKDLIEKLLIHTLKTGNGVAGYDFMLLMLPNNQSHGHHTASSLLALSVIKKLKDSSEVFIKIPTVIAGSEFVLDTPQNYSSSLFGEISIINSREFQFNRQWKLDKTSSIADYQLILFWMCSEHKSQGLLIDQTLTKLARKNEQYFYFLLNDELERFQSIERLFQQLADLHR